MEISGYDLFGRGGKYYCHSDFVRNSPEELSRTQELKREKAWWNKLEKTT